MKVRFTPRALSEAERKQTWWRKNRQYYGCGDAKNVVVDALRRLVVVPGGEDRAPVVDLGEERARRGT